MQSSALFPDLDTTSVNGNHPQEDERSLQIALELSNLGLLGINEDEAASYDDIAKGKKSQNMTECVPVPSSEHVAEIVGRQGKLRFGISVDLTWTYLRKLEACVPRFCDLMIFIFEK